MWALFELVFSWNGLLGLAGFGLTTLVLAALVLRLTARPYPNIVIYPQERYFQDPVSGERHPLPCLGTSIPSKRNSLSYHDLWQSSIYLSVVVPAYNEQDRLPTMLEEALDYLESQHFTYEVIVVDDGSRDHTTEVALTYAHHFGADKVRVITLAKNRGKGGAVRLGVLAARGQMILMADADGATKFEDYEKLDAWIQTVVPKNPERLGTEPFDSGRHPLAIGSRAHLEKEAIAQRSLFRTLLMKGFHLVVWLLTVRTVRDTQCGFKLFTRSTAHLLFTHLHVERWAFDVELLVIAERLKLPIGEIPVRWTEVDGSKLVPVFSWLQMGFDVARIFVNYATGAHRFPKPPFAKVHATLDLPTHQPNTRTKFE